MEFSVYPAPRIFTGVVEPYNSILTTQFTLEHSDFTVRVDNKALYDIGHHKLSVECPPYTISNRLIGETISFINASLRFEGPLNVDLIKFQTNLASYQRIHFPMIAFDLIISANNAHHKDCSMSDITTTCFDFANRLVK